MLEAADTKRIESVLRSLATAARSLRLYPPASPIPRQSVEAVESALAAYFEGGAPILSLSLARDGFTVAEETIGASVPGAKELSTELREHGVAELDIMPQVSTDEILSFLTVVSRSPEEVREDGGLAALCAAAGVECIRVTDVYLTVIEQAEKTPDGDVEAFLAELAGDPARLSAWYKAASAGDPAAFSDGLLELVSAAGPMGRDRMFQSLSSAFLSQESEGRDALLALAMQPGEIRELTAQMFSLLSASDIAGSILGGLFGRNMLSLSNALTSLPLERVSSEVRAEVQAMLPGAGHTSREAQFLDHMLVIRAKTEPEPALVDSDRTYKAVLQAASLNDADVERARGAVAASGGALNAAGVRTMLALLDQQQDFELYCAGIENIAAMVPRLIEQGDLQLAARVITELSNRQARNSGPWPDLGDRLERALQAAAGPRAMGALVDALIADPSLLPAASEIVKHAGDAGGPSLVAEAIARKTEGVRVAEELLGRRVIDLLNAAAPTAQWYQLGPVVERLAREGGPHSLATIEALQRRPDEQSRREVATSLAGIGGPAAAQMLAASLRDPSPEVAIIAARAIARSGTPGSATLLSARLTELDVDNADFLLGRELIGALARTPDPAADDALAKLASRRALIKRGHFAEVQALVGQAQQLRAQGGAAR